MYAGFPADDNSGSSFKLVHGELERGLDDERSGSVQAVEGCWRGLAEVGAWSWPRKRAVEPAKSKSRPASASVGELAS